MPCQRCSLSLNGPLCNVTEQLRDWLGLNHGHVDVVKELLSAGADYQKKDIEGWTALDWAKNSCVTDAILDFQNQPGDKSVIVFLIIDK